MKRVEPSGVVLKGVCSIQFSVPQVSSVCCSKRAFLLQRFQTIVCVCSTGYSDKHAVAIRHIIGGTLLYCRPERNMRRRETG